MTNTAQIIEIPSQQEIPSLPDFTRQPEICDKQKDGPYYLNDILVEHEIGQIQFARHIRRFCDVTHADSTFNRFLRKRAWAGQLAAKRDNVTFQIVRFLRDHNVPDTEIARIWETGTPTDEISKRSAAALRLQLNRAKSDKITAANAVTREKQQEQPAPEQRIAPELTMLEPAVLQHFGFHRDPFPELVTDPDDLFADSRQSYIIEQMKNAISSVSILAVIGEVGSGKTEARRWLQNWIYETDQPITMILPELLDKEDINPQTLVSAIARELNITRLKNDKEARISQVKNELARRVREGQKFTLVFEEAHRLNDKLLRQLKTVAEWTAGFKKMMSIILIGQPELEQIFHPSRLSVREFSQRCTKATMAPLGKQNIIPYVQFKLQRAGVKSPASVITDEAIMAIWQQLQITRDNKSPYQSRSGNDFRDMSYPLKVQAWLSAACRSAWEIQDRQITPDIIKDLRGKL